MTMIEGLTIESEKHPRPVLITAIYSVDGVRYVDWMCSRCRIVYTTPTGEGRVTVTLPKVHRCDNGTEERGGK